MESPMYMAASNPDYSDAVKEINSIIGLIKYNEINGARQPGAVLYVGHKQWQALQTIEPGDRQEIKNETFCGYPLVRVHKDSWLRLSS
ncbi:hypothetical protein [Gilvimarinus chinensis]|uniref:hypothetical protein n=1 Tax=Gilvimarinus chinensis TaxID=396005 RepID=UPI00036201BE|nr:hypothetical protein [Gilvimarinus chinensis]